MSVYCERGSGQVVVKNNSAVCPKKGYNWIPDEGESKMRRLSIATLAMVGLQGCIYYVYPPPKEHVRPGDLEEVAPDASEVLQMGGWAFELSNPVLSEMEGCQAVDLGAVDYFATEVVMSDLGNTELLVETPFGELYGLVDVQDLFYAGGTQVFDGMEGVLDLQASITAPDVLTGSGRGIYNDCEIMVDFAGFATGLTAGSPVQGDDGEID